MNKKVNTKSKKNVSKTKTKETKINEKETKNNGLAILFAALVCALVIFLVYSNKDANTKKMPINKEGMPSEYVTKGEYLQYLYLNTGNRGLETVSVNEEAYDYLLNNGVGKFLEKYDQNYEFTSSYFYNLYVYDKTDLKNLDDPATYEFVIRGIVEYTYTVAKGANADIKETKLSDSDKYKYPDTIKIYMNANNIEDQDFSKVISKDQVNTMLKEALSVEASAHYPEIKE